MEEIINRLVQDIKDKFTKKYMSKWTFSSKPVALWKKEVPLPDEVWSFFEEEINELTSKVLDRFSNNIKREFIDTGRPPRNWQ